MVDVDLELGKIIGSANTLAKTAAELSDAIKMIENLLNNPTPTGMSMWSQGEIEARYKQHEVAVIEARAYIAAHKDVKNEHV